MADLTQTAASVAPRAGSAILLVTAGEAITQGMPVYRSQSDSKYYKADADGLASADVAGIAATPASADGEKFIIAKNKSGTTADIIVGATLTQGETYVVSTNVGRIAPIGDLASGDFISYLGVASSATILKMNLNATGIQKP